MAAPRLSVVLVVGAVLLATGGAAYYFFAIFSADEQLRVAREQVDTWEERWQRARGCLLGETPLAATFADAITAREITPESASDALGDCSSELGKLTRPEGNNTGMDGVEAAWVHIDRRAIETAKGYVAHLQLGARERSFFAALEALAQARAELRRQVKRAPEEGELGPPPRELAFAPLTLDGAPLTALMAQPSGEALIGKAFAGERSLVVRLQRGATGAGGGGPVLVEGTSMPAVMTPAYPELGWGALAGETLLVGALGATGELTESVTAAKSTSGEALVAVAALGAGPARAVLYYDREGLKAAISANAGATWKTKLVTPTRSYVPPTNAAHADLTWSARVPAAVVAGAAAAAGDETSEAGEVTEASWLRIRAETLPELGAPVTVRVARLLNTCPAPSAPWLLAGDEGGELSVLRMDAPAAAMKGIEARIDGFIDCDDEAVLLGSAAGGPMWSCRAGQCRRFPWLTSTGIGSVVGGKIFALTRRGKVAAVLTDDAAVAPQIVRMPEDVELYGLYALGGAPYLVIKRPTGELAGAMLK